MKKKFEYTGLSTKRTTVGGATPLLAASLKKNKLEVGNNGWVEEEHEIGGGATEQATGFSSTNFDVVFE